MSPAETPLAEQASTLEQSFRRTFGLLTELAQGLRERRAAWISARPDTIAPSVELEAIAQRLASEDEVRRTLVDDLGQLLPGHPGVAKADLRVNVTRIAAALPRSTGQQLQRAADEATRLAQTVRTELALGRRLLEFSQRTHDSMVGETSALRQRGKPRGYDRSANARPNVGPANATIIDGKM